MPIMTLLLILFFTITAYAGLVEESPLVKGSMLSAPEVYEGKTPCQMKIPSTTRQMLFNFFHSIAKNNKTLATNGLTQYSKMVGKLYLESSGNPLAYTDMNGTGSSKAVQAFYKNKNMASISMYRELRNNEKVKRNVQTNFGILQISIDQLFWRPKARTLFNNTIIRFHENPKAGLQMCGTISLFNDDETSLLNEFDSFKSCSIGTKTKVHNGSTIPVVSGEELDCFDKWISYCPTLNIGIGLELPNAYFETSGAAPLCNKELSSLLNLKDE